jgi:queuine tRNA-ribosyltransferase
MFRFELLHQSKKSRARVGRIHTPHGIIETPNFVPVGTHGTLKALPNVVGEALDIQLMFCNTYHLMLHPGSHIVRAAGGLHTFINRKKPLITDSGGFQVFSLAYGSVHDELKSRGQKKGSGSVLKISEEGVLFRSYRDGNTLLLTAESSIQAQKELGADIIIPLDELPPYHIDVSTLRASFERTHRWELRSLAEHLKNQQNQAIYGVIHGGIDLELRKESCKILTAHPFDGYAIGGSVGKNEQELFSVVANTRPHLPEEKPTHLLGIGDLNSLNELIPLGIDTFDSSYPTRAARHGLLLTKTGGVKIEKNLYAACFESIEKECLCHTCQNYTLAYLHHLFKAKEMTALTLATLHNLHFMVEWMRECRKKILENEI